jgi:hypothetical protein
VRTPETCWAVHKRQVITWEIVASSYLIYLNRSLIDYFKVTGYTLWPPGLSGWRCEVSVSLMLSSPCRQYWRLARCCTWFLFSFLWTQIHRKQVSQCVRFFLIQANHDDETGSAPPVFSFLSDFNSSSAGIQMPLKMYIFSLHLPPAPNLITNTTFTPRCECGVRYPRLCDTQLESPPTHSLHS